MSRTGCTLLLIGVAAVATMAQQPSDDERSAWRYRRSLTPPVAVAGAIVAVPLPADVQAKSAQGLRDVRLVDAAGREVPYLVHEDTAREVEHRWTGRLAEAQRERREFSTWTVDFGERIAFDRLELDVPSLDFTKRMSVDVSDDQVNWRELGRDYWVFDRPWQGSRVHGTAIALPMIDARYVRLQGDDTSSPPLGVRGVTAVRREAIVGTRWSEETGLDVVSTEGGRTRYRVALPDGYPIRRLALDADDGSFARQVRVVELGRNGGERTVGEALLYRLRFPDTAATVEQREIDVAPGIGGALVLEVASGDNPALVNPRVRVSGPRTLLVAVGSAPPATLYYGNTVTRQPAYGLESLRVTLASVPELPLSEVGEEVANPSFRQPAPLAFVPTRGAGISPAAWRYSRPLMVTGSTDVYSVTLSPTDVAQLQPDLADLRLVDASDRQVPYVVESNAALVTVPLQVTTARARAGTRQTSALRLAVTASGPGPEPLRLSGVRLQVREGFFQRSAVLLQPRRDAPLGAAVVTSATLRSARRDAEGEPVWVRVPLGDLRATELILEVQDGDNAPLTVLQAQAEALVPRITFKAEPGPYLLLMGNAEAQAPSYELGLLRQEVLTYAAVPLESSAAQPASSNPAYDPGVADIVRDAPPRLVLWTTLGLAVAVLLFLIRRILGRPTT
jgi:hypothetical protein